MAYNITCVISIHHTWAMYFAWMAAPVNTNVARMLHSIATYMLATQILDNLNSNT